MRKLFVLFIAVLWAISSCGQLPSMPGKSYNSLRLYPSTDKCLLAGDGPAPTLGYLTFGNQAISPLTERLYYIYRQGSDHNITGDDSLVKVIYSDDEWATFSGPITIATAPGGGINLTSVDIFVTSTGRVLMFYSKQITGTSVIWFKYSDTPDLGTLSSEVRMTTDYSGGYVDATGSCIETGGNIYKSCWAAPAGTEVPFYRSTDDGLTWTKISNISPTSDDYDETHIALHPNGTIYAFQRSNDLNKLVIRSSTNLGSSWSSALITDIPARGRNGAVITPEGVFCVITREPLGGRTRLAQSVNGVNWTSELIDNRTGVYMYGGCVWKPASKKVIAVWSVEATNITSPGVTGPTVIIKKDIVQSIVPVAPPTYYYPSYQNLLDFAQANGETLPSTGEKTADNTLLGSLRGLGLIEKTSGLDELFVWEYNNTGISNIKLRSWVHPWKLVSLVASPSYTVNGYDFNGTTQYITSPDLVSNFVKYSLNSASVIIGYNENTAAAMRDGVSDGAFSTLSNATALNPRSGSDLASYFINDGTNTTIANTNSSGHFHLQRTSSTVKRLWRETTKIDEQTVSSTARATNKLHIGATKYSDQVNTFSTRAVRYFGYGDSMVGVEAAICNAFNARRTALGL